MEQLVILIVAGVIALANFIIKKNRETSDRYPLPPPVRRPTIQRKPIVQEETDEERMRRFLEALGVPPTSQPPRTIERTVQLPPQAVQPFQPVRPMPRVPVQSIRPRRRVVQAAPPPPFVEPQSVVPQEPASPIEPVTSFPEIAAAPSELVPLPAVATALAPIESAQTIDPLGIRAMLQNPTSLRAAMVLREVMGPPRGLQPFR